MRSLTIALIPVALLLSACAAKPHLTYSLVGENREGHVRFTLPQSLILVSQPKQAGGRPEVNSVPTDTYVNPKSLLVRGEQTLIQETNLLNVTFLDNTTVVTSVGFEIISKTNDLIKLVSAAFPINAAGGGGGAALENASVGIEERTTMTDLPNNKTWKYMLVYDKAAAADGSLPYDAFLSMTSSQLSVFPTSHCRSANFTLKDPGGAEYTYALKVADPTRVSLVKVPNKGTINMHSACGFNLAVTAAGGLVDYESLNSLVKLANDLKNKK